MFVKQNVNRRETLPFQCKQNETKSVEALERGSKINNSQKVKITRHNITKPEGAVS